MNYMVNTNEDSHRRHVLALIGLTYTMSSDVSKIECKAMWC